MAPTLAVDDIMIAAILGKDNQVIGVPADWIKFVEVNNGTAQRCTLAWKRAVAGDSGATFAFTKPTDNNILFCGVISAWRGAITTGTPIDATAPSTSPNPSQDTVTYAIFNPTETTAFVVAIGVYNDDATNPTSISGTNPTFAENFDLETALGSDGSIFGYSGSSDGAATGNRTQATTSTTDAINIGVLFGFIAAAGVTNVIVTDSGSGVDAILAGKGLLIPDSGSGSETLLINKNLLVAESASGLETILVGKQFFIADSGLGSDAISVKKNLIITDLGNGVDALLIGKNMIIIDSGLATEVITATNLGGAPAPAPSGGRVIPQVPVPYIYSEKIAASIESTIAILEPLKVARESMIQILEPESRRRSKLTAAVVVKQESASLIAIKQIVKAERKSAVAMLAPTSATHLSTVGIKQKIRQAKESIIALRLPLKIRSKPSIIEFDFTPDMQNLIDVIESVEDYSNSSKVEAQLRPRTKVRHNNTATTIAANRIAAECETKTGAIIRKIERRIRADPNIDMGILTGEFQQRVHAIYSECSREVFMAAVKFVQKFYGRAHDLTSQDLNIINEQTRKSEQAFWRLVEEMIAEARATAIIIMMKPKAIIKEEQLNFLARIAGIALSGVFAHLDIATTFLLQEDRFAPVGGPLQPFVPITHPGVEARVLALKPIEIPEKLLVIWVTEKDAKVCPICLELEGRTFDIDDPTAPKPVVDTHFGCRCRRLPIDDASGNVFNG